MITKLGNQLSLLIITDISISVFGFLGFLARMQREIPPEREWFTFNNIEIIKKMDVTVAGEQDDDRYPWVIHSMLLDQEGRPKYLKR